MHPDLHSMESPPVKIPDILPKAERFMDFLFNIEEKIGANNSTLYTLGAGDERTIFSSVHRSIWK